MRNVDNRLVLLIRLLSLHHFHRAPFTVADDVQAFSVATDAPPIDSEAVGHVTLGAAILQILHRQYTSCRLLQPVNVWLPMVVTLLGMVMLVRPLQP